MSVPRFAGVFSALGLLLSPPRVDAAQSITSHSELAPAAHQVGHAAQERLASAVGSAGSLHHSVDLRYLGQAHELSVPYTSGDSLDAVADRFHQLHQERNGFARPSDEVEIVTVRAVATANPTLSWADLPPPWTSEAATTERRLIDSHGREVTGQVVRRSSLRTGDEIAGPAVIEDGDSTTYLDSGDRATVAGNGAVVIEW